MKVTKSRIAIAVVAASVVPAIAAVALVGSASDLNPARVAAVAAEHPKFTVEQRAAIVQELRTERYPQWKNLSTPDRIQHAARVARRLLRQKAGSSSAAPTIAPFIGNQTILANTSGNFLGLQRQSDCSLTLYYGTYGFVNPTASAQFTQTTPHYEQVLHGEAGLTTKPDVFAGGCTQSTLGIGSRRAGFLGTTQSDLFLAGTGYNGSTGNSVYFGLINPASTATQTATLSSSDSDASEPGTVSLAFGDLNGDGLADVVGVDGSAGAIHVYLAQSNGSLSAPTTYTLPGTTTEGATVADVNGDGKADVIVATRDGGSTPQQEHLCVLTGLGTGQLNAAQCVNIATPTTLDGSAAYIGNLIAANVRSSNIVDIVGANGVVLLNNGTGTFAAGTPAFTPTVGTSDFGPNLSAGDFNKDGKLDLAMDDGAAVHIYLGNGDGTFSVGTAYASNSEVGYLTATDLDGDGNSDLYVGLANGGLFSGDQFDANKSYALMGNGDGTFQGAPFLPFVYTGTNLVDLTGDGKLDAVGVGTGLSAASHLTFTSYLGNGQGSFAAKSTLSVASLTFSNAQNNPYSLNGIDSFGIADVNGDGKPDLVFLATGLDVRPLTGFDTPGILMSVGDGAGNFAAPTFIPSGHFVPGNDVDANPTLSNIRLIDVNGDGKADLVFNYVDEDYTVAPGVYYSGVAVQLGNGDGTFQAPQTLVLYSGSSPTQFTYNVVGITDLNGDGKPDLLIMEQTAVATGSSPGAYTVEVALGNGDGTFRAPTAVTTNDVVDGSPMYATQYVPLVVADMNGDGVPDIVTLGMSTSGNMQVAIALGNGDGTFKAPNKFTYDIEYELEGIAVGDFNGDGKLDVAISGYFGSADSGITFGNGDGTLSVDATGNAQLNELIYLPGGGAAIARDFNGDGKTDLLDGQTLLLNAAQPAAATFSLSVSSSAGTVTAGQSATDTLTLTPGDGFTGSVALSCTGLPQGASCSFAPASVTLSGSAVSSALTITTTARTTTASVLPASQVTPGSPWLPGGMTLAVVLLPFAVRGRTRLSVRQQQMIAVLIGIVVLSGCGGGGSSGASSGGNSSSGSGSGGGSGSGSTGGSGGGTSSGTPAGTYAITVTATSGSTAGSAVYNLTVN
jgi:hypothetical protein